MLGTDQLRLAFMMSAMLCLGQFVFALDTLPYQNQQHARAWRHPSSARVGLAPARQFIGPDDETMTLSGVLLPELTGSEFNLDVLAAMADSGDAWVLVDGVGNLLGLWVIVKLARTRTLFFADGLPRRIEFTLELARVDDDAVDRLGEL